MSITFGSVCSGIEAASVAWGALGWQASWFAEIEPFPCAVLAHHYPSVPNFGDMTSLPDLIRNKHIAAPDILCGGTPCQSFSVAGSRKSLDDERGNLSLTFCEIANALDSARGTPCIVFWENVPGVLNTSDNAFGCFLAGLAGEVVPLEPPRGKWANAGYVFGPTRTVAWRVLDAQYFGVAQRRRRVFVVASARAGFNPAAVLFEFEGVRRDSAPSREAGKEVAGTIAARFGSSRNNHEECVAIPSVTKCLTTKTRLDSETETLLPIALAENTIGRLPHNGGNGDGPMYTLNCTGVHGVAHPIPIDLRNAGRDPEKHDQVNRQGVGVGEAGDPAHTLTTACVHGVAQPVYAFLPKAAASAGSIGFAEEQSPTLKAGCPSYGVMRAGMAVRRLTPVECERLQGFPDGYTNIPWRKKPEAPDGPRYKALGNSWAVPNVRWIGKRIAKELS